MLPKLYGKASNGKIKVWYVYTENDEVCVCHGQLGGKITEKRTTSKPKNIGKSNETTGSQQALLEANAKWEKQLKKDYREKVEDIPISVLPNLAHKYQDNSHTVEWDCTFCLPKLDGVRCSVYKKEGTIFFQSRGGEAYPVIKDIAEELESSIFSLIPNAYVDGELYCHGMFLEDITSCVKKHNQDTPKIEFHIFDLVNLDSPEESWHERYTNYQCYLLNHFRNKSNSKLKVVKGGRVLSEKEVIDLHEKCVGLGYEGVILRNSKAKYNFGNRCTGIIKYKVQESEEFIVVGFSLDKNGAGVPICEYTTPEGEKDTFKAPFATTAEKRVALWENRDKLVGKHLTVDFEKLSKYGKPTKPIGKAFREVDEHGNPKV